MDYKETLHLPQTDFEMRGNLTKKQDAWVAYWNDHKLYHQMREVNKDKPDFVFHDGPPFANGHIHIGHALNKILKDFIVRSRHKLGYRVHFVPGWDTHGLPIETVMAKKGVKRKEIPLKEYRTMCRDYAQSQIDQQMDDLKRLGTLADYDHPYITFQHDFEAEQVRLFGKMCLRNMIYKGKQPVYWSPSSESALAEAEIEYKDKEDASIYVPFKVVDGKNLLDDKSYFVIWTTTPWTLPANLGICVNPDMDYALVECDGKTYVMLNVLVDQLMTLFKLGAYTIKKVVKGKDLEYMTCQHPFYDRTSLVMVGNHVSAESGTGCVHTAPGFGYDDYLVGKAYGLDIYCNVDAQGRMEASCGDWLEGLTTEEANQKVIDRLKDQGQLLNLTMITHSYPHDWRTKKPVIYRATPQWFASIQKIKEDLLVNIKKVEWKPAWGETRLTNMIKDRNDWTISRQRAWGLPIPIFYAEDGSPIIDEVLFNHVADLFEEFGASVWVERSAKDLLPEGYTHPKSPNGLFTKEKDILDVWFDSGSSHTAALKKYGIELPVDLYLEGSDQYRGWFNSSLTIATAVFNKAPYKKVVSHGFVMDDQGDKYSKSKGNALSPNAIVDRLGADILRLWVASVDYTSDVALSEGILKQVSENYRKIRNTLRFMAGNLKGFSHKDRVDFKDLPAVDRQVLFEVNKVLAKVYQEYEDYNFQDITNQVTILMTNVLSAYYMDFTKDILYILKEDHPRRRAVQTVLDYSLESLMHALTPILPFTMEELYHILYQDDESIQLAPFTHIQEVPFTAEEEEDFARLFMIRDKAYKALEEARNAKVIGTSLKAKLVLTLSEKDTTLVNRYFEKDLAQWLIVSKVEVVSSTDEEPKVEVKVCEGHVCQRCWNVVDHVEEDLCDRCRANLYDHH